MPRMDDGFVLRSVAESVGTNSLCRVLCGKMLLVNMLRLNPDHSDPQILPTRPSFPTQSGQERISPELVVIIDVVVARRHRVRPLAQYFQKLMLDQLGVTMVPKGSGKTLQVAIGPIQSRQQHTATVAGGLASLETDRDRLRSELWK